MSDDLSLLTVLAYEHHRDFECRRQVQVLVETLMRGCSVSEERHGDIVGATNLRGHSAADRQPDAAADEAVGAKQARPRLVVEMHRSSAPAADARVAPGELRDEVRGVLPQVVALQRKEGLRHGMPVPAVCAGDHVGAAQPRAHGSSDGFFAEVEVKRAWEPAGAIYLLRLLLEGLDPDHALVQPQ